MSFLILFIMVLQSFFGVKEAAAEAWVQHLRKRFHAIPLSGVKLGLLTE